MPMAGTARSTGSLRGANTLPRRGGLLGLFGPQQPPGLLGYSPAAMRNAALKRGLLGAGIGLLTQGTSPVPISFGQSIGQGLAGFAQGADEGRQQYKDDWKDQYAMSELQREQKERAEQDKAFDEFLANPAIPFEIKNWSRMNRGEAMKYWAELQHKPTEAPKTREVRIGNEQVTQEWDNGKWKEVGRGSAFKTTADTVVNVGGAKFDEHLGKGIADVYAKQVDQASVAVQTKGAASQLRLLLHERGGALDGLSTIASGFGLAPEGANDVVAAQAIVSGLIPKQRVPGSGTTSDYDAKQFAASLPRVWNQPGANELIIDTMEAYADYQIAVGDIITEVGASDSQNKAAEIRARLAQLPDPFALWKQNIQKMGTTGTPQKSNANDLIKKYGLTPKR